MDLWIIVPTKQGSVIQNKKIKNKNNTKQKTNKSTHQAHATFPLHSQLDRVTNKSKFQAGQLCVRMCGVIREKNVQTMVKL
jgi:hypothetical protein